MLSLISVTLSFYMKPICTWMDFILKHIISLINSKYFIVYLKTQNIIDRF